MLSLEDYIYTELHRIAQVLTIAANSKLAYRDMYDDVQVLKTNYRKVRNICAKVEAANGKATSKIASEYGVSQSAIIKHIPAKGRNNTSERNKKIIELVRSGKTYAEIGLTYDLSPEYIRSIYDEFDESTGVLKPDKNRIKADKAIRNKQIYEERLTGATFKALAVKYNLSKCTIANIVYELKEQIYGKPPKLDPIPAHLRAKPSFRSIV